MPWYNYVLNSTMSTPFVIVRNQVTALNELAKTLPRMNLRR
jgi:hypothetical protein